MKSIHFFNNRRFVFSWVIILAFTFLLCLFIEAGQTTRNDGVDLQKHIEWVFEDDDDMGQTVAESLVLNTRAGRVAIFGNGYASSRGEAVLFALGNIEQSLPVKARYHTGRFGENGIVAEVTAIDDNSDGFADFVYAGDLKGNLWKLDIRDKNIGNWDFAFKRYADPKPFFTALDDRGNTQPITAKIDVMRHCRAGRAGNLLLFGTGKDENSFGSQTGTQAVYGLWDWQRQWKRLGDSESDAKNRYFGNFTRPGLTGIENFWDSRYPEITELTLLRQSFVENVNAGDDEFLIITKNRIDWWHPETGSGAHVGWYFDLPNPGERVITKPMFRDGTAVVISTIPPDTPGETATSVLYMFDACNGGEPHRNLFDVNQDRLIDGYDTIPDSKARERRPGGLVLDFEASDILELPYLLQITNRANKKILTLPSAFRTSGITYWYIPDYDW